MTRKEMEKYFSRDIYAGVRKYVKKVMDEHPEITDELVVEFAAGKMEECEDGGVEISVDDALRLTEKHDPIPTAKDFMDTLMDGGIETQGDLMDLFQRGFDKTPKLSDSIPQSVASRAAEMIRLGKAISEGNKDIVLMGIPQDLSWGVAHLKLAFFTEDLTEEEQNIIQQLRNLADVVEYYEEYDIGYAVFRLDF